MATHSYTFIMEEGSIGENTADYGGGVYNGGTFTMKGGSLSDNTANIQGGGVYNNSAVFNMEEGSISGNTAVYNGGGVLGSGNINIGSEENGESKEIIISGNKLVDKTGNLAVTGKITIKGKVSKASKIGVTTGGVPTASTSVVFTNGLSGKGSISNFFSDRGYAIIWSSGDSPEAQLINHKHQWTIKKAASGDAVEIKCNTPSCFYSSCIVTATANNQDYTGEPYDGANIDTDSTLPPAMSVTRIYKGRGDTIYGPSGTVPTKAGSYTLTVEIKVAADPHTKETVSLPFSINKAPLTITAKDQTFVYNGNIQGPGDMAYEDAAEIANVVAVEGLIGSDALTAIIIDGQAREIGDYPEVIVPSGAAIGAKGEATDNYDISYVKGTLAITPIPLQVTVKGSSTTKVCNGKEQIYEGTVTATSSDKAFDPSKFRYKGSTVVKGTNAGEYTTKLSVKECHYDDSLYKLNCTIGTPIKLTILQDPKPDPKPEPIPSKGSSPFLAKMIAKGRNSLLLTWSKVKEAEGYDIFFIKCGKESPKMFKTVKGNKTFKWMKKNLKVGRAYKAIVKAYVIKKGKKTYVKKSPPIHAYTSGGSKNYTSPKSVTIKKTRVLLKAGKTYKIKAGLIKIQKGKKLMPSGHARKLRYISSNKKIARVSKTGKITAKAKGSCKIYVIAVNGVRKAVKVTVN